jgi:hypothetical protein
MEVVPGRAHASRQFKFLINLIKVNKQMATNMNTNSDRLWRILNSGIFITLLTSAITSGVVKFFQDRHDRQEMERTIKQADLEIEGRISQFLTGIEPLVTHVSDSTYVFKNDSALVIFNQMWQELKQPPGLNKHIFAVNNEFQQISTPSVMAILANNLLRLGHDVNEAKEIGFANYKDFNTEDVDKERKAIKTALEMLLTNHELPPGQLRGKALQDRLHLLFDHILLGRWTFSWPYVDCRPGKPFC